MLMNPFRRGIRLFARIHSPNFPIAQCYMSGCYSVNRTFSNTAVVGAQKAIKQFKLADIGEGITECEVIRWYAAQKFSKLFLLYHYALSQDGQAVQLYTII